MANVNTQSPVPIRGKGFVVKPKGNYGPGEYRFLVNAEITNEGILQQRRSIVSAGKGWDADYAELVNPYPIVGFFFGYAILSTDTQHIAYDENFVVPLWNMSNLVVPVGGNHRIIAAFVYNNKHYWLTLKYDPTGLGIYTYYLYEHNVDLINGISTITWAGVTETVLFSVNFYSPITSPQNVFIHKDRLWIVTPQRIYYSKATNPTIFAVPDGGFFDIPDETINGAAGIGDSIYFTCSNGVYVITYAQDIDTDGYLRKLANIGGDSICIHKSVPYFVGRNGEVYSVSGMSVDKVHEGKVEDPYPSGDNFKIISFEEYLIVLRRNIAYYSASTANGHKRSWKFDPATATIYPSIYQFNVFWINTDNGSTHVLDFTDANDLAGESDRGYVIDVAYNPAKGDLNAARKLFILTNRVINAGTYSYKGNVYCMRPYKGDFVHDGTINSNGTHSWYKPRIHVEWDSIVPDGNEYLTKKFRSLLFMSKFPYQNFEVAVCYDNQDFDEAGHLHNVSHTNLTDGFERMHHPVRLPLNQRGRSINVRLQTLNNYSPLTPVEIYDQFEVSDVRVLWSYTKRLPEERVMPRDL